MIAPSPPRFSHFFPLNAPQSQPGDASGGLDFNGSDELNDDELNGPMQVAPADLCICNYPVL